jgi:hypothetical protein
MPRPWGRFFDFVVVGGGALTIADVHEPPALMLFSIGALSFLGSRAWQRIPFGKA